MTVLELNSFRNKVLSDDNEFISIVPSYFVQESIEIFVFISTKPDSIS